MRLAMSEFTASVIALLFIIIWFCWVLSAFGGWLGRTWKARHLNGWDWVGVLASAACLVIGSIVYQPARWWETLIASIILLGMAWTPLLIARWGIQLWRVKMQ